MQSVVSVTLDPTLQNADAEEFQSSLSSKVVGQPEAIKIVTNIVQSYMAGLNDPSRSISNLLFLGPTVPARLGLFVLGNKKALARTREGRSCQPQSAVIRHRYESKPVGVALFVLGDEEFSLMRRGELELLLDICLPGR